VFGWTYEDLPTPDGRSFARAFMGGHLVAAIAPQNPLQHAAGIHARWNIYLACSDAAATVQDAAHAGGTAESVPEAIGDTGVLAFLGAPGGGTTGIWQAGTHTGSLRRTWRAGLGGTVYARAAGRCRLPPAAFRA
jgi:predicted enzyme related to lactoylglutathione lyase